MEGRLIFALLVCLALVGCVLGNHEMTKKGEMKEASDDEVKLSNGETLRIKFDHESGTRTKLEILLYKSAGKRPSKALISAFSKELPQNCRVRKEFVTGLTDEEKAHYIDTVKTAASDERYKKKYNVLLTLHKIYFDKGIHYPVNDVDPNVFLPWHRWFLLEYENLLRNIDPNISVPYWDWSLVGASPFESSFWATGASGFGGDGNPPVGCVTTGPFREGEFSLIASAGGGCLKRNFCDRFVTTTDVNILLREEDLINFQSVWQSYHNDVHNNIGGTMPTDDAAAAPEFIEHHGFVDKVFSDWQKMGFDESYFEEIQTKMPATDYYPNDFLDLENQPGDVCVKYEDPQSEAFLRLKSLSLSELQQIPRLPLPKMAIREAELLGMSLREFMKVTKLRKSLEPKNPLNKNQLTGPDAQLGFKLGDLRKHKAFP